MHLSQHFSKAQILQSAVENWVSAVSASHLSENLGSILLFKFTLMGAGLWKILSRHKDFQGQGERWGKWKEGGKGEGRDNTLF